MQIGTSQLSSGVSPGATKLFTLNRAFPSSPGTIQFTITFDPGNEDAFPQNNSLRVHTHGLAFKAFVQQEVYDQFNAVENVVGTYSFEDWLQWHISEMNDYLFPGSVYPIVAPNGIRDRIRVDEIVVTADYELAQEPENDVHYYCMDGKFVFRIPDDRPNIVEETRGGDYNVIHELGHEILGLNDLYAMNLRGAEPLRTEPSVILSGEPLRRIRASLLPFHGLGQESGLS